MASFVPDVCQVGIAGSAKCGRLLQNDRVSVVAMTSAHLGDDARHILLAAQRHERFVSRCRGACKPSATAVSARDNNSLSFHSARLVAQGIWMTDTRVGVRNWLVSACPHDGRNATASRQTTNIAGSQSADPICATSPHRDLTRFAERHTETSNMTLYGCGIRKLAIAAQPGSPNETAASEHRPAARFTSVPMVSMS